MKQICFVTYSIVLYFFIGCKSSGVISNREIEKQVSILSKVAADHKAYVGKQIIIKGLFMGYGGNECSFPPIFCYRPAISRSDWIFSDGEWCIYVTGRTPQPFNPMSVKGVSAELTALVRISDDDHIFLQLISIR